MWPYFPVVPTMSTLLILIFRIPHVLSDDLSTYNFFPQAYTHTRSLTLYRYTEALFFGTAGPLPLLSPCLEFLSTSFTLSNSIHPSKPWSNILF